MKLGGKTIPWVRVEIGKGKKRRPCLLRDQKTQEDSNNGCFIRLLNPALKSGKEEKKIQRKKNKKKEVRFNNRIRSGWFPLRETQCRHASRREGERERKREA